MNNFKEFVLQCDFFAHGSLLRYKQQESYRTLIGGIVSIVIVILFFAIFFNLVINTFNQSIIVSQIGTNYDDDPSYSQLIASPSKNYMFAISLSGIDLSSNQRYFDIVLANRTYILNGTTTTKTTQTIPLAPCNINQWSGISPSITNSYTNLKFSQWLCPPIGQTFQLQGKFTSDTFKFAQIIVSQCTNNPLYPGTTCHSSSDIDSFLEANGQFTFNFYYINPVINSGDKQYISYYLEDSNYFSFDPTTNTGVSANLFHSDYTITTDTTILPWSTYTNIGGTKTLSTAVGQNYKIQSPGNQYFKFYLRKAPNKLQITRSFQKIDQTLSFIGGLFGTIILFCLFLKFYSKYSYQLDIGEKMFKQNKGGSFGSEYFNFIVFLGYLCFNLFTKFNVILNWKTMKKYHKCRQQCQRQLNIDLLFQKISHLQQISKIVLEDHHIKTLLMVPKPTLNQAKLNRKRYLIKSMIYHQLQRKEKACFLGQNHIKNRLYQFFKQEKNHEPREIQGKMDFDEASLRNIQEDFIESYKKMESQRQLDDKISKKIIKRLNFQQIVQAIFQMMKQNKYQQTLGKSNPRQTNQNRMIQLLPSAQNIKIQEIEIKINNSTKYNQKNNKANI